MILIMGMPGAGKSVQSALIRDELGFHWLSTGQLFRKSDDPEIKSIIESGALVDDDIVTELVQENLSKIAKSQKVLLDGFPRNSEQANWLLTHAETMHSPVAAALYLIVNEVVAVERLGGRGRADDTSEVIERRRLEAKKIEPTLDALRQNDVRIIEIDANGGVEDIFAQIKQNIADVYQD